ncbi:ABC transporter permease [Asanoa sp. WMMD1127]|uniref:ABC transporter permease subunit n=1 Tax=Asanoa sp. WMMD1127 TaxID=3016107 RepID=UPI002416D129|nr:ABC transporter permease subunit [Asanoa sp. WMMD1127]MDG4824593.1 ABC transporter permease [Asanoa sp. WMMD1127]
MRDLIRAETVRLFSTRLWVGALVAAVLGGGGLVGLVAGIGPQHVDPPLPGLDTPDGARAVLGLVSVTLFLPALFGTVAVTGEYRHRSITTTFLFSPVRWKVLVAKLAVHTAAGIGYGVVLACTATATLYLAAATHGTSLGLPPSEVAGFTLRLVAACAVYTLIGVGVGALARHQLVALAVVVGYFYFLELLLVLIPGVNLAYPFLPGGATSSLLRFDYVTESVSAQTGAAATDLLGTLQGGLVLFGYAALASLVAMVLPLRRDVR